MNQIKNVTFIIAPCFQIEHKKKNFTQIHFTINFKCILLWYDNKSGEI